MTHKHRFRLAAHSGIEGTWRCACGERVSRAFDKIEKKAVAISFKAMMQNATDVNYWWHKFRKQVLDKQPDRGYPVILRAERFVARYPESGIIITWCDDSYAAGSRNVLIPHQSDTTWHGLSLIHIPQCNGEKPTKIGLYPSHNKELIAGLAKMAKLEKKPRKKEKSLCLKY